MIELITKETAVLFDCVGEYEEKGRLGQVSHIALRGARGRRSIRSRQIVAASEFAKESNEIVEKLRRLVDLMQVGLQVRTPLRPSAFLHVLYGTMDVVYNPCSSRPSSRTTRF